MKELTKASIHILQEKFDDGLGLTSTPLKVYSGPTLENWSEITIKLIISDLKNKYPNSDIVWGKGYITSDFEGFGEERLDQHIQVNGKYVYLQEDRAWIDKPFYTLKRAVIRNIMMSCKSKLAPNIQFGVVGYSIDIKNELINTCDYTQGYGDRIRCFSLTGRRRNYKVNGKVVNWFETGFVNETVVDYVNYVYSTLENAINA